MDAFGVCGVGGLERGTKHKHLHIQAALIIHAPSDPNMKARFENHLKVKQLTPITI